MEVDLTDVVCCAPLTAPVLSDEEAAATARLFGALAEPARVRLVKPLVDAGQPASVCGFVGPLGLAQGTGSHPLNQAMDPRPPRPQGGGKRGDFSANRR